MKYLFLLRILDFNMCVMMGFELGFYLDVKEMLMLELMYFLLIIIVFSYCFWEKLMNKFF